MLNRLTFLFSLVLALFVATYATLPTASASPELQTTFGTRVLNFNGITATTRACAAFPLADKVFVQLIADVTTVNTSSVAIQYTNNGTNFTNGETLSSTVIADTATVADGNLYTVTLVGQSTCVQVTTVNTYPITITAYLAAPARS